MQPDDLVLVIDDDEEMRSYLELALSSLASVVSSDGSAPTTQTPRLAFVDLLLGDGDALLCIGDLLAREVTVVVTTGLAPDAALVERARQAGVGHFLYKPFSLKGLREVATRLLA